MRKILNYLCRHRRMGTKPDIVFDARAPMAAERRFLMKDGFIKAAAATPEIKVNNTDFNRRSIAAQIFEADSRGAKIIVFPELCITGYTCGDLFGQSGTVSRAKAALSALVRETADTDILFAVGLPYLMCDKLYNVAAICKSGRVLGFVPKTYIPNYSEFYEARHFAPAPAENTAVDFDGYTVPFGTKLIFCARECEYLRIACEICEDMWVAVPPSSLHAQNGAEILLNLSASDETVGKNNFRRMLITAHTARTASAYIYSDAGEGESTTDLVFGGHNIIAECGKTLAEAKLFENGIIYAVIDTEKISMQRRRVTTFQNKQDSGYERIYFNVKNTETDISALRVNAHPFVPKDDRRLHDRCETILKMQSEGLKKRIKHIGLKTVTVGISGGLDSTLALLVTVRAFDSLGLDPSGIIAVTMPCFGTTDSTYQNSVKLTHELVATLREVKITDSVIQHMKDIGASLDEHDVTYENAQARERTQVLMDISNKTGGIVIGTGDLSELALGFATYNGDHMSMYGVNCSIPKTLVRYLVRHTADKSGDRLRDVLYDILDTPVSPELLPPEESGSIKQRTEDIVGPYELHDFFLYQMIRFGFTREKIQRLAEQAFKGEYDSETISKWLKIFMKRFFANQFKRSALPDGPKVGTVSLSPRGDWRMPSDAVFED